MKYKPMDFSTPEVRLILDGVKTMTRRVMKPPPSWDFLGRLMASSFRLGIGRVSRGINRGDILFVRETHWVHGAWFSKADDSGIVRKTFGDFTSPDFPVLFEQPKDETLAYVKRPSVFMKRGAARIFLEVIDMRIEHLREITGEDKKKEGFSDCGRAYPCGEYKECGTPCFMKTWDKLNAKQGCRWRDNPWVWVFEFKRVENAEAKNG